jgi:hypothetical protein
MLVRELGLNAESPRPGRVVNVRLSGEVQELPFPLKFTVTVYVAVLPGNTVKLLGFNVTVLGFESVNVFCA